MTPDTARASAPASAPVAAAASASIPDDVAALSFEAAMAELETIVRKLETGDATLDASVELFERGHALRQHCDAQLKAAEARIDQINVAVDGTPTGTTPFAAS